MQTGCVAGLWNRSQDKSRTLIRFTNHQLTSRHADPLEAPCHHRDQAFGVRYLLQVLQPPGQIEPSSCDSPTCACCDAESGEALQEWLDKYLQILTICALSYARRPSKAPPQPSI